MLEGIFEGWRYSARLTVSPAEEDWEMVRLPRALAPLYVALRPLRLLHKIWSLGRTPSAPLRLISFSGQLQSPPPTTSRLLPSVC